jgi:hypothetical protein
MTDRPRRQMEEWARARGLEFAADGLLPPWSATLAAGGAERSTHDLCRGTLPGGLPGVVAHHVHFSHARDGTWEALTDTVVLARLPEGARAVCELRGPDWRADPPEDPRLLATVLGAGADSALAGAPPRTTVELRYGTLCVTAPGAIADAAALDALCAVAAALAAGLREATAALPRLDPAAPLPAPPDTPRARWIDEGVRRVTWNAPPASVPAAAAAYAEAVRVEAARSRRRTLRIALAGCLLLGLLALAAGVLVASLAGDPPLWTLAIVALAAPFVAYSLLRGALGLARDAADDHSVARAAPWGLEAFAREYARARGLVLEDVDAFRHRFDSPFPGSPQQVLYGPLGAGVTGRLVLWIDRTDRSATRHWLLAVVPGSGGPIV